MINILEMTALLLTLCAVFSWFNRLVLRLPNSVGLLLLGLAASLLLVGAEVAFPEMQLYHELEDTLTELDFTQIIINGMLAFLLFAGAMNVNFEALRRWAWPVAYLALAGTVISTLVIGMLFWGAASFLGLGISLTWSLAFGALISPTDPIAVLTMLKTVALPERLQIELEGEALFNGGIGIVLFTFLVAMTGNGTGPHPVEALASLAYEAGGGVVLGLATGYLAYRAMRAIDDFAVEVLITLALVTATYALALRLGVSGPLATVAAGLLIGTRGRHDAMSERTEGYVSALWTLIDEVLNSVFFLLIGLEVLVISAAPSHFVLAALAIPIAIVARAVAVGTPLLLQRATGARPRNVAFLTWAGVHGGISIALALALPSAPEKPAILAATYAVVLFAIVVQGLTLPWAARRRGVLDQDPRSGNA